MTAVYLKFGSVCYFSLLNFLDGERSPFEVTTLSLFPHVKFEILGSLMKFGMNAAP